MVIAKTQLLEIINDMPDKIEVEDMVDKIMLNAKIDQALAESENGLGMDWDEFKEIWAKEDL